MIRKNEKGKISGLIWRNILAFVWSDLKKKWVSGPSCKAETSHTRSNSCRWQRWLRKVTNWNRCSNKCPLLFLGTVYSRQKVPSYFEVLHHSTIFLETPANTGTLFSERLAFTPESKPGNSWTRSLTAICICYLPIYRKHLTINE